MNKHFKHWAAAGLMALFMGTAAAAPQVFFQKDALVASANSEYDDGTLRYSINHTTNKATVLGIAHVGHPIDSFAIADTVTDESGIPADITNITDDAFNGDFHIREVDLSTATKLTTIGNNAFRATSVSKIVLPNSVTSIGTYAFSGCKNLTSVTLSSKIKKIPASAFASCKVLSKITIPANVTSIGESAFDGCEVMSSVTFKTGSKLKTIGKKAFNYNYKLAKVTIPATVTSIGESAFSWCQKLKTLSFASGSVLKTIGERAFEKNAFTEVEIPSTVTSIGQYAFRSCESLTTVSFPSDSQLNKIGDYAFSDCTALTGITIPLTATTIGQFAFINCKKVTEIVVPDKVKTIGDYAFSYMDELKKITIGKGVAAMNANALAYTKKLSTISVVSGNTAFAVYSGALYTKDYKTLLKYPPARTATTFNAHASTVLIADKAFQDNNKLTKINLSDASGLTTIGNNNFGSSCPNINKLNIPDSENKSSNGANVLKKYNCLFCGTKLFYLNDSVLVKNASNSSKAPAFHTTIAKAMFDVFENYDKAYFMNRYVDAYAKYAVNDAYSKYGNLINPNADITNLSQVEKAYAIYKWVHNQAEYDHEEFAYITDENGQTTIRQSDNPKNHCNASVFLHKKSDGKFYTVCDGYARAYSLIMNAAGLECHYVASDSYLKYNKYISHAFNCVKIGSEYYIADPTSGAAHYFLISAQRYRKEQGTFSETDKWYYKKISDNCKPFPTEKPGTLCKYTFADMDSNSYLGRTDYAPLQMYLVKRISLTAAQKKLADVNTDGSINYLDAQLMMNYLKAKGTTVFCRMGDVNMDGQFTKADANILSKYLQTTGNMTEEQAVLADMNNDGKLNAADLSLLKSLLLYKPGDVNRDGKVNKTDKQLILNHIAHSVTLSDDALWYADYNGDGSIDVSDVVEICVDYNISD